MRISEREILAGFRPDQLELLAAELRAGLCQLCDEIAQREPPEPLGLVRRNGAAHHPCFHGAPFAMTS